MKKNYLSKKRRGYIGLMKTLMGLCAGITCAVTLFIIIYVLCKGLPHVSWNLLSTKPSYLGDNIGILPDILNTLYMILATLIVVLPLGVGAAVYLNEYAANKRVVGIIEYAAETLSGNSVHNFRTGGHVVFLSVSRHENLPCGRCHDPCNHEPANRHENNSGKP